MTVPLAALPAGGGVEVLDRRGVARVVHAGEEAHAAVRRRPPRCRSWFAPPMRPWSAARIALRMSRNDGSGGDRRIASVTSASASFEPASSPSVGDQRLPQVPQRLASRSRRRSGPRARRPRGRSRRTCSRRCRCRCRREHGRRSRIVVSPTGQSIGSKRVAVRRRPSTCRRRRPAAPGRRPPAGPVSTVGLLSDAGSRARTSRSTPRPSRRRAGSTGRRRRRRWSRDGSTGRACTRATRVPASSPPLMLRNVNVAGPGWSRTGTSASAG